MPPDFRAGGTADLLRTNPFPAPPFPTANEVTPTDPAVDIEQVLRGRRIAIHHDCGACHIGGTNPARQG